MPRKWCWTMKVSQTRWMSIGQYVSSSHKFKTIFLLLIFLAIYAVLAAGGNGGEYQASIIDSALTILSFNIFNIIFFALLWKNTVDVCTLMNTKFDFIIMRLQSRKKYILFVLKYVLLMNILFMVLFAILYLSINLFIPSKNFMIADYEFYGISNMQYFPFFLFRYVSISLLLSVIFALLYLNFKKKSIWMILLVIAGFLVFPIQFSVHSTFSLFLWTYFCPIAYESFYREVLYSILYLLVLLAITFGLGFYSCRNKRMDIA